MEFGQHRGGDHQQYGGQPGTGDTGSDRDGQHCGNVGRHQRLDPGDGDGGGSGVNSGQSAESGDSTGTATAIYGDGDVHGQHHARRDHDSGMEFVGCEHSSDQQHHGDAGNGDECRDWGDHDHGDVRLNQQFDHVDGDGGGAGVDYSDAGQYFDSLGHATIVYGDGHVHGQNDTESDHHGGMEFVEHGSGNGQQRFGKPGAGHGRSDRKHDDHRHLGHNQ